MISFWIDSVKDKHNFEKISENLDCDVCIVGAGMVGLSIGYYLSKIGFNTVILEKENSIGLKTSGNTTGKITYQHNLFYNYLITSYGENYAKAYLEANKKAILNIKKIIDLENIDCDFEYQTNYIYTTKKNELKKIKEEISALKFLGEKDNVGFTNSMSLPFNVLGGLFNKQQAQFNSVKYMHGLANCILKNNSKIFCNSLVSDFEYENNLYTVNVNDCKVKSKYLIIASHYPFPKITRFLFYKNVSINIIYNCSRYAF